MKYIEHKDVILYMCNKRLIIIIIILVMYYHNI